MSEATAACDALKARIKSLEDDLAGRDAAATTFQLSYESTHKLMEKIAAHVNAASRGGNCSGMADSIMWAFDKLKAESAGDQRNAAKSQAEAAKLLEEIDVLKADHEAAIEGREKELNDTNYELKEYNKKYKELEQAAKDALATVGLQAHPSEYTVQATVLAALSRLADAALNDTVDSRIKVLEEVCYSAESGSGCMCTAKNPWDRVKWVLQAMESKIRLLKLQPANEKVTKRIYQIQRNLNAEDDRPFATPYRTEEETLLHVLDLIEKKAQRVPPDEIMKTLWSVLRNLDPTGASRAGEGGEWSTEYGKALALIQRIAEKAYEGQNIKAACLRLKELL